jgi:hypothetical protein
MRCRASGRGPVLGPRLLSRFIRVRPTLGLVHLEPGGLGHRGGALRHHGDASGNSLGEGGVGGHGRHLVLPQVEVAAREGLEIGRRV